MPHYNRQKLVADLLRGGHAVFVQRSWDSSGVTRATRLLAERLEHPVPMVWDEVPPDPQRWSHEIGFTLYLEQVRRALRSDEVDDPTIKDREKRH